MKRIALLLLAGLMTACGGSDEGATPSGPSAPESNLRSAPSSAHTVTDGDVTVRFWFEVVPAIASTVSPGGEFQILPHCRRSRIEDLWLRLVFEFVGPDGSLLYEPGTPPDLMLGGHANRGIHLRGCEPNSALPIKGFLPRYSFGPVAQMRVRVYLRPPQTTNEPAIILRSPPDALVFEPLNWRQE